MIYKVFDSSPSIEVQPLMRFEMVDYYTNLNITAEMVIYQSLKESF